MQVMSFVIGTPEEYYGSGLSDHAPLLVSFGRQSRTDISDQPIPKFICTHSCFKTRLNLISADINLVNLPDHQQLPVYKACIREAAKRTREHLLYSDAGSQESRRMAIASVSRAIWFNNVALARKLIAASDMGSQLLEVVGRRVYCKDYAYFDSLFDEVHLTLHNRQAQGLRRDLNRTISLTVRKQLKARLQAARRRESLFFPRGKRLKLAGICVRDGQTNATQVHTVTNAGDIQNELRNFWGDVYSLKPCDVAKAKSLLKVYCRNQGHLFSFSGITLPTRADYRARILRSKDSACGPDGIPYSAYRADSDLSAEILATTSEDLSQVAPKSDLLALNRQLVWFAPKGAFAEDNTAVYRFAGNLRTIFGSNADSKLIAGCVGDKLTPPMLESTPEMQRGFCRGRQMSLNIVDLDLFMRVHNDSISAYNMLSMVSRVESIPGTALYDFCNAFPTVLHEWLHLVLEALEVPYRIRLLVISLYSLITAYSSGVGDGSFLFNVLGGVRTGCPLSSILFILCINPFIYLFQRLSDDPGCSVTRICADDFGSCLQVLKTLKIHASIFGLASCVAGLHLKPGKCVLIITCTELTELLRQAIQNWLRENVPEFAEFRIQASGKYLGWILGVDSVNMSYKDPLAKFVGRVDEVCGGNAPAATSICRYNQRAVTVLSYVSQFAVPPANADVAALSHWATHRILKMPPRSMARQLSYSIGFCSAVEPIPLVAYCAATQFRFAHSERDYLLALSVKIRGLMGDDLRLFSIGERGLPVGRLDSPSILSALLDSLEFKGPMRSAKDICEHSLQHRWLLTFPSSPCPTSKGLQSSVLDVLLVGERTQDLPRALAQKASITLGAEIANSMHLRLSWFLDLNRLLELCPLYIRMCWLKTICGAWCTSVRLHTLVRLPCVFGCPDCVDELSHYLICPTLWLFAREALHIQEISLGIGERLCLRSPSFDKLKLLAFCFSLYHAIRNDSGCIGEDGNLKSSLTVQNRAAGLSRSVRHFVSGVVSTDPGVATQIVQPPIYSEWVAP